MPPDGELIGKSGSAPLAGVRVADLSRVLAGPYCTMVLADLGADVVKVERPEGGDETRSWGPPFAGGEAAYYLSVNREQAQLRARPLPAGGPRARARAVRPRRHRHRELQGGGADRLGVGYDEVRERNPRVVYCSITGFGSERTPPGRPGYDFVAQAESGLMSITGPEEGPPYKVGVALVDVLTGLHAAAAVLGALHGGEGARIEVPLLDSGLAGLVNVAQNALVTGREPERHGNAHPNIVPYQDFETSSGRIAVAAANDGLFRALCSVMGLEELPRTSASPRTPAGWSTERSSCRCSRSASASAPRRTGSPTSTRPACPPARCARCRTRSSAAAAAGRPATHTVDHPTAGPLELVASPIWGATRDGPHPAAAARRAHAEVLRELGRSEDADRRAGGSAASPAWRG